jgi:RNA recognition motif-containing protein
MNIYVSNLSFNIQDEDLKGFFTDFGEVTSAKVIMDRETNQSRGFGFVEMADDAAAKKAIAELDNGMVEGRNIKVMEAKPKEDRPSRNSGGGGGGYNNGGSYNKNRY